MDKKNKLEYMFSNPGFVKITKRVDDENELVYTNSSKWIWSDLGKNGNVNWNKFNFSELFMEVSKSFIFYRLKNVSISSVLSSIDILTFINKNHFGNKFPWSNTDFTNLVSLVSKDRLLFGSLKIFYGWGYKKQIFGFSKENFEFINEIKSPIHKPYQNIFLAPKYLNSLDENNILVYINETYDPNRYSLLVKNILLQLCFEIAPRPSQLYCLNNSDLEKVEGPNKSELYFSLNLPMTKKVKSTSIEKRLRKISFSLGNKIEQLIQFNLNLFNNENQALFKNEKSGNRLSTIELSKLIIEQCGSIELSQKTDATLFRHHLAQALADQGASAETISEILGHNSTLPARAYIASTPSIGIIKTKALGNNETYKELNTMFLTGKIIERRKTSKERWVKGMIGSQYIGGIGTCGLTENTACPKNPVYSCYTCNKFHPFVDGSHEEVKISLQKQAQFFVDIAEKGLDLEHNRPVVQLERTIEAVENVLQIISNSK